MLRIGPILAVMVLGIVMPDLGAAYTAVSIPEVGDHPGRPPPLFVHELPAYVAARWPWPCCPSWLIFALFQLLFRRFQRQQLRAYAGGPGLHLRRAWCSSSPG